VTPPTGLPRVTGGHRAVEGAAAVDGAGGAASPLRRATDVVVGMADLRFSTTSGERLITYALGSCLGIAIHDPVAGIAGLLHVMLPESAIDAAKAASTPAMFVDTGVPLLFKESYKLGARKERIVVKVAGGASSASSEEADQFQIGKRNILALRKLLWRNNVILHAHHMGGFQTSRTLSLVIGSGRTIVRTNGTDHEL
jgi:chemotaxis protein CheD